jgi:hypothetical protein
MTHRKLFFHNLYTNPPPFSCFREELKIAMSEMRAMMGVKYKYDGCRLFAGLHRFGWGMGYQSVFACSEEGIMLMIHECLWTESQNGRMMGRT